MLSFNWIATHFGSVCVTDSVITSERRYCDHACLLVHYTHGDLAKTTSQIFMKFGTDVQCLYQMSLYGRQVTQCRCDPYVVSVHLFALATMVVCFVADCKHINRKDKCSFFSASSNTRSGKTIYQILIPPPQIIDLFIQMRSPL